MFCDRYGVQASKVMTIRPEDVSCKFDCSGCKDMQVGMFKDAKEREKALLDFMDYTYDYSKFTAFLREKGFYTAPASTTHHGNYEGGLFDHSFMVAMRLNEQTNRNKLKWQKHRSPLFVGFFHDICKIDAYIFTPNGIERNPDAAAGHGDKSVAILSEFLPLSEEEELCIRWHMGAFDEKENWNNFTGAIKKYDTVLYTHHADMLAAHVDDI